jgi:pimeloyl-ACP methyl ester carboxylesterase
MDHRPLLPKIKAPTLVIAGRFDPATPLPGNEFIRDHIPGAKLAPRISPTWSCRRPTPTPCSGFC